jgi:hypothetical protein
MNDGENGVAEEGTKAGQRWFGKRIRIPPIQDKESLSPQKK